jgi:hypothetical protein
MTDFSINLQLNELTSLAKKLGEYEYRFGITSEQMFSNDIKANKFEINLPLRNIIVEWMEYYNEYISKYDEIVLIVDLLAKKNINHLQPQTNIAQPDTNSKLLNQLRTHKFPTAFIKTDDPHHPSIADKYNLTEIRLPFNIVKETSLRNGETIQYSYGLRFGKIIKKVKDYGYNVTYSASIDLKCQIENSLFDLIKIKDGKIISIPESISYRGYDYPSLKVSYRLDANQEFWDSLTEEIDNFFEFRSEENNALSDYHHLSFFIDEAKIKEINYVLKHQSSHQNYTDEDSNNLVKFEIPIEVNKFEISRGVYWLEEAGYPIEFEWLVDPHCRFGCLGNKIYPITEARANLFSYSFSSRKFYGMNTPEHDLGSIALNNVKAALERLSGVTSWSSEHCSDADIKFKWDLFFKVNSTVYPLQIKSSFGKAQKALSEYETLKLPFIPPIIWINPTESEELAKQLVEDITIRFSKILGVPISKSNNSEIFVLPETKTSEDIDDICIEDLLFPKPQKPYNTHTSKFSNSISHDSNNNKNDLPNIDKIGTGKKAHLSFKKRLIESVTTHGGWDKEAEKILEAIAIRGSNPHYLPHNHEAFLKELNKFKN